MKHINLLIKELFIIAEDLISGFKNLDKRVSDLERERK